MKRLKTFVQRQARSLVDNLRKYSHSLDIERLHQIRVNVKKVKAILGVINYSKRGFKAHKNFVPFRDIFRSAGSIREPDVLIKLLFRYEVAGIKDDQLGLNDTEHLIAAFVSDIPQFAKTVKIHASKLEALSGQIKRDDFKRYLKRKKKLVKSQLLPKPRMSAIHKVRKNLKEIIYLSGVYGELKGIEAKFYNKRQDTIGRLHDKQVLLEHLKSRNDEVACAQCEIIKSDCISDQKEILALAGNYYR